MRKYFTFPSGKISLGVAKIPFRNALWALFLWLSVDFFNQCFKHRQALLDHFIADAVADTEVAGTAEAVAGDHQKVFFLGHFGEIVGVAAGGLDEQIEGTVGLGHFIAEGSQSFIEGFPVGIIGLQVRPQLCAPGDDLLDLEVLFHATE